MTRLTQTPVVSADEFGATTVSLWVGEGTTDKRWRDIFNELAKDSVSNAEAMGDQERTILKVRLAKGATTDDIFSGLTEVNSLVKDADKRREEQNHIKSDLEQAAARWWDLHRNDQLGK